MAAGKSKVNDILLRPAFAVEEKETKVESENCHFSNKWTQLICSVSDRQI
jgi:hypothetical protein